MGEGWKVPSTGAGSASKGDTLQIESRHIIFYPTSREKFSEVDGAVDATAVSPAGYLFKYAITLASNLTVTHRKI